MRARLAMEDKQSHFAITAGLSHDSDIFLKLLKKFVMTAKKKSSYTRATTTRPTSEHSSIFTQNMQNVHHR